MSLHTLKFLLICSVLSLTACAPRSNLHQVQHQIKALNKEMQSLTQQAAALKQQNALNAHSAQGAYLLPDANAPAFLKSHMGLLEITLLNISPSAGGVSVSLSIRHKEASELPPLTGALAWQADQNLSRAGSTKMREGQQDFSAGSDLKPDNTRVTTLILRGVTPQTLRWIRIHDIRPHEPLAPRR